jgi:hypothetical protein
VPVIQYTRRTKIPSLAGGATHKQHLIRFLPAYNHLFVLLHGGVFWPD